MRHGPVVDENHPPAEIRFGQLLACDVRLVVEIPPLGRPVGAKRSRQADCSNYPFHLVSLETPLMPFAGLVERLRVELAIMRSLLPSLPKLTFMYPPLLIFVAILHHSAALAQAGFATFAKHSFRTFCARRRARPESAPRRASGLGEAFRRAVDEAAGPGVEREADEPDYCIRQWHTPPAAQHTDWRNNRLSTTMFFTAAP